MTNVMPLGPKGVKRIIRTLNKADGWSVRSLPGRQGFYCAGPTGSVTFGRSSPQGNVFAEFRRAGIEVDPRRVSGNTTIHAKPVDNHVFASLASRLDEMLEQKPLIDVPSSVIRSFLWTDHAFNRMKIRNVGVFEVASALHAPDHAIPEDEDPTVLHFMRGDIEVIVRYPDSGQPVILTVLDMLNNARTTPRVALAPVVPEAAPTALPAPVTAPPTAPEEVIVVPSPEPVFVSKYQRIRDVVETYAIGEEFAVAEVIERVGGDHTSVAHTSLSKWVQAGIVERVALGRYRRLAVEPKTISPAHRAALNKAHAARRGETDTARELVLRRLRLYGATTDFTLATLLTELGEHAPSDTSVRRILRGLVADGVILARTVGTTHELHYRKAPKKRAPAAPAPAPAPESTVVFRAPAPQRPAPTRDEEEYDVSMGFSFVAALPKSDLYDLIDSLNVHRTDMVDHPGAWAQFATYAGGRAHEIAEKRAAAVEHELNDSAFRFQVRRLSSTEVGLFASYHPAAG